MQCVLLVAVCNLHVGGCEGHLEAYACESEGLGVEELVGANDSENEG